jgi:hypothetical protein
MPARRHAHHLKGRHEHVDRVTVDDADDTSAHLGRTGRERGDRQEQAQWQTQEQRQQANNRPPSLRQPHAATF